MAEVVKVHAAQHDSIAEPGRDALLPLDIRLLGMMSRCGVLHDDWWHALTRKTLHHSGIHPTLKRLRGEGGSRRDVCQDFFFFAKCLLGNGFEFASKHQSRCVATHFAFNDTAHQRFSRIAQRARNALRYIDFRMSPTLRYNGFRV